MNTKTNKNTTILTQNQLVISYLKRNSRRSLTSEQVCEGVNSTLKTIRGPKTKSLTVHQISKCLNRFSERNMVKRVDKKGLLSSGRPAIRWGYVRQ